MSPHQYLIRQRMRAARHMLATSTEPIKAIARNTGYINTENFCRAFRQHVGLTAAAYRRTYRIYP
jgi:transcriptional regulator GlxA family with amidase domain